MNPADVAPVLPGETLAGKYRVERILGRGGMGIVVAARHLELEERVAIKFLLRKDDENALQRFLREARAAAKVKSEHVCRVFDVGRLETGEPYLVMEYLDGVDLAERLRVAGPLSIDDVARWMIEVCAALAEAHAIGIVHRDLKPANIFLAKRTDESSTVKVLDFGISKLPSADGMTSTTALMGTPVYMSPEQVASSKEVDHLTDVWSLGVIMYELVSGKTPFAADSIIQLSVKIREADAPALASGNDAFDAVVTKCLQKERKDRWASVGELASALAPFTSGASVDLARRAARTLTAAKAALAETMPDERDVNERLAAAAGEASAREPAAGQATLEPLSTAARPSEAPRPASRWPRAAVALAGIGIVIAILALLQSRDAPPPTTSTPSAASPDVAPPPASIVASSEPTQAAPSSTSSSVAAVPPSAKPAIAIKPRPGEPVASAASSAPAAPIVSASAAPEPAPAASTKKKRELDRDDPYAH